MTGDYLTRSLRVLVIATLCSTGSVLTLWADPITVTSGHFDFGRGPAFEASFTFSGTDGFFLNAFAVPISDFSQTCRPTGCRPGDILNMSLRAGAESGRTPTRLPPAFTVGTSSGAIVNGTEFARAPVFPTFPGPLGLAGSLRFDAPSIVLPSSELAALEDPNPFSAPFAFSGHVAGFSIADVDARTPLFNVDLLGQGRVFIDFESGLVDGVFREGVTHFVFAAAPAATPEPTTLALFGTGLVSLIARARSTRRRE